MTYAVLRVPALAYVLVKAEITKLPQADYGHMIDSAGRWTPERLKFDRIALEAMPRPQSERPPGDKELAGEERRDALAAILELVDRDGLVEPRDLDVALDAILSIFGLEHDNGD